MHKIFLQAIYQIVNSLWQLIHANPIKEYITCGIPQGSVLGPTLFLIYMNDLPDCHAMQTLLFADDTALLMSGPNILGLQNTINDELKNVQKWLIQNKLTLNLNKTNYLLFHPAKEKQIHLFLLNYDGNMLMQTNESKVLGSFYWCKIELESPYFTSNIISCTKCWSPI